MKRLLLKLMLSAVIIGTSYSFAGALPQGWSSEASETTPYGNVTEQLAELERTSDTNKKIRKLNTLKMMGTWYAKQKTGGLWLEKIMDALLAEAGSGENPNVRKEALYIVGKMVEKTCGFKEMHSKVYSGLHRIVLEDPNPMVRKAVLGVGPLYSLAECHKKEAMGQDIINTLLAVIAQDPDMDVLDAAVLQLSFCRDKGISLPDDITARLTDAARQRLMVMMPDQAWASFARGPVRFHAFEDLHGDLIKGPLPNRALMAAYAMSEIDSSLKYANDLDADSPVRVRVLLLKYLLTTRVLFKESLKSDLAGLAYMAEAQQQDEELSLEQLIEQAKNIGTDEFIQQAGIVGGGNLHVKEAKEKIMDQGGQAAILQKIAEFTDHTRFSPAVRQAAWSAVETIQTNENSRLKEIFTPDIIQMLSLNLAEEPDPEVLGKASPLVEVLKQVSQ